MRREWFHCVAAGCSHENRDRVTCKDVVIVVFRKATKIAACSKPANSASRADTCCVYWAVGSRGISGSGTSMLDAHS